MFMAAVSYVLCIKHGIQLEKLEMIIQYLRNLKIIKYIYKFITSVNVKNLE